uniref:Uncharacterized protein n=1 Tax=Lepeophtheirus salmonis TaxID=72036 RepID=A0A0K2TT60_LEPSM
MASSILSVTSSGFSMGKIPVDTPANIPVLAK